MKSIIGKGVIIEDSQYIQNLLQHILENSNYEIVGVASTGKAGFRITAEKRPDVVFLDISLPDLSAEEVVRGLLSINRSLRIVIMGSIAIQKPIMRLLTRGASDYIPKPIVQSQVVYLLKRIELDVRAQRLSRLELIVFLHGIFYSEIIKTASKEMTHQITNAVHKPLKRLKKQYPERYDISISTLRIFVHIDEEDRILVQKIYRQINNVYRSILRNLEKLMEFDLVISFIQEAFQSFGYIAGEVYSKIDYNFPTWKGYTPSFIQPELGIDKKIIEYIPLANFTWNIDPKYSTNYSRLLNYRTVVNYDPRSAPKFPRKGKQNVEIYGIYSIFDDILGPKTAIIYPPVKSKLVHEQLMEIPRLLDLTGAREMEPFIHASETFASINLIFVTQRNDVRGSYFDQMLSICVTPLDIAVLTKLSKMKGILRAIVAQISESIQDMTNEEIQNLGKFKSEPAEIISELVDEVRRFI